MVQRQDLRLVGREFQMPWATLGIPITLLSTEKIHYVPQNATVVAF